MRELESYARRAKKGAITALLAWVSLAQGAESLDERKEKIEAMQSDVSQEALQRKQRSVILLRAEGVPINEDIHSEC